MGSLVEHSLGAAATSASWPQGSATFLPSSCPLPPQHILYCIVDSECKSRDVLQSYFDLLGELMKFNVDAFKRFNKYINTDAKVRLTQAPWGLLHHSEVILEPRSFPVFGCWFEIGEYWGVSGPASANGHSPLHCAGSVLDPGYTGVTVSATCGQG